MQGDGSEGGALSSRKSLDRPIFGFRRFNTESRDGAERGGLRQQPRNNTHLVSVVRVRKHVGDHCTVHGHCLWHCINVSFRELSSSPICGESYMGSRAKLPENATITHQGGRQCEDSPAPSARVRRTPGSYKAVRV
ncbi:unnamed protein product [Pleuronectes platessa]|uniref:Uncharacterized protein n=1 Tax=Pleuronectes platessa TaxID=8262 RepID=A0A9N7V9W3_PLEPL|nr:unnamed protein product [Pleuronectes platessa]